MENPLRSQPHACIEGVSSFILDACHGFIRGGGVRAGPRTAKPTEQFEPRVGQPGKDVVWVPTPQALVDKMLDMAKVTPNDFLMDLGSGDGRTVITAAKRGVTAMGVEYNPDMVELSKRAAQKEGVADRATFVQADLFKTDLSKATVITMFLLPSINMQLRPTLLNLKPGTRIVSNTFTMEDWEADETAVGHRQLLELVHGAAVDRAGQGAGHLEDAAGQPDADAGVSDAHGQSERHADQRGKMNGDQISFTAGGTTYTGRVNAAGNAITGGNLTATKVN